MAIKLTKIQRADLISQMKLQDELERRVQQNRLKWFTPTGSQDELIKVIGSGEYFVIVFSAANATGKTALMTSILGGFIFGSSENPYLNHPIFQNFPYPKRARIISTPKNLEEIGAIQTEIKKWWPVGKYEGRKKGRQFDSEYIAGEWVCDLMSYEQDVSEFEGATLGCAIFDEPPPLDILYATISRLRKGGLIMIFMTPLDTGGEILEDLSEKETIEINGEQIGKVKIIYADIESSCEEHGVRGFLKHKDIVQMTSFYDPDEKDARASGKPIHLSGRIYSDFEDKEPYIVDDFVIPDEWTKVNIIDPHDGIPFAMTWAAIDRTGQVWVYDEYPYEDLEKINSTNLTILDYARIIREKEGRDNIKLRIFDPYFGNKRYSNTGKTVKQELADLNLIFEDGDTSGLDLGHKRVREFLKYQKAMKLTSLNTSKLHIFKRCRNHWRSMLRYKRKVTKSGEIKDKMVLDETYKHFCDNIRHLLMRKDFFALVNPIDNSEVRYKIVGELKDVHFYDDDEDESHSYQYKNIMAK